MVDGVLQHKGNYEVFYTEGDTLMKNLKVSKKLLVAFGTELLLLALVILT